MAGIFDLLRARASTERLGRALRDGGRYMRERQFAASERAFDCAMRTFPADPRPRLAMALLHRARGQESSAATAFEPCRTVVLALAAPEDEQPALLARGYERLGDGRQALASCHAALAANPEWVCAREALARTAKAAGDLAGALEHYALLTQYAPEQAEYQRAISRLQIETICWLERSGLVLIGASPDAAGRQVAGGALQISERLHVPTDRRPLVRHATRSRESRTNGIIAHRFPTASGQHLSRAGEELRAEIQPRQTMILRKSSHRWSRELSHLADELAAS